MTSSATYIPAPKAKTAQAAVKATKAEAIKRLGGKDVKVEHANEHGVTWTREWADKSAGPKE